LNIKLKFSVAKNTNNSSRFHSARKEGKVSKKAGIIVCIVVFVVGVVMFYLGGRYNPRVVYETKTERVVDTLRITTPAVHDTVFVDNSATKNTPTSNKPTGKKSGGKKASRTRGHKK